MGWLKELIDEQKGISRMGTIPSHWNFLKFGNQNDKECGLHEVWLENGRNNLKWLDEHKDRVRGSVYDLPEFEDKAVIFVGMGESLNKAVDDLKDLDDRFIVVATNSSMKYLLDHGIKPDYVILIDGKPGDWTMDVEGTEDITAIFSVCAEPEAMRAWKGHIVIVPYGVPDEKLKKDIEDRYGEGLASGGNSFNSAIAIFVLCTMAKIFLLVGNNLSFSKTYYADRGSRNDDFMYFFETDIYGERVRTFIPLYEYKIWLENLIDQLVPQGYYFCNCSEGILGVEQSGKLMPGLPHMPLEMAIEQVMEAWKYENMPWEEQNQAIYDIAYKTGGYNPRNGIGIWEEALNEIPDFEAALDVGCGTGMGLKGAREKGFNVWGVDIADNKELWEKNGVGEFCRTAPAHNIPYPDNRFDFVLCTEVMEHIPEKGIEATLKEIHRVGSDKFIFTISLTHEKCPLGGILHTHVTLQPKEWWLLLYEKIGYHVALFRETYDNNNQPLGLLVYAVKDKAPYENGEKPLLRDHDKVGVI